jgi:hypothetical protein
MRQNAGLFSQHVSRIIMPIFRSTLVSTAFWCPNRVVSLPPTRVTFSVQHTQLTALRYTTVQHTQLTALRYTTVQHTQLTALRYTTVQHTQLTALRYTTQTAYWFGHQKAVLTNVLLKMGIIMLETC